MLFNISQINSVIANVIKIDTGRLGRTFDTFIASCDTVKLQVTSGPEGFAKVDLRNPLTNQRLEIIRDTRGRVVCREVATKLAPTKAQIQDQQRHINASAARAERSLKRSIEGYSAYRLSR